MSLLSLRKPRVRPALLFPSFVLLLSALVVTSHAQLTEATLKGVVQDSTGGALVTSPVTVTNESTGQERSTSTSGSGAFVIAELPPGKYTVTVQVSGFKTFEQKGILLNVGLATELTIRLEVGKVEERVEVHADGVTVPVSTEGRLSDNFNQTQITDLPLPKRDVFSITSLSAGATAIPGAANSTKLTNSPVVTVNGNRYRGNNYVLDGSIDTNPNNTGEPAIVPSLESVEEAQVQTGNFSSEFGRGNGAVVNLRTKSGSNQFHGKVWEYQRNAALNATNYFAIKKNALVYNQFGANLGGPIFKNRTFFFGSYEGTRNSSSQALNLQVETPEFRQYVSSSYPAGIAAQLLQAHPAPTPLLGAGGVGAKYQGEVDLTLPDGNSIPGLGQATVNLPDRSSANQYLVRIDHSFHAGKDKLTGRWIEEYQKDQGGYSSSLATLGKGARGYLGPFDGSFGNLNIGHVHVFDRTVNDARFSLQTIDVYTGVNAVVPEVTIVGMTAPFGDIPKGGTSLRTYEFRDTATWERGKHMIRAGGEARKIFKGLSLAPTSPGSFAFTDLLSFASDKPFKQTLTVDPTTGEPVGFPRYFVLYETGAFVQDDWKVTSRLNVTLGIRHDYFGTVSERHDLLSSLILGPGATFDDQLASASIGRVSQLYHPQKKNFSPRLGFAYDPFGDGKSSIRGGASLAYQPHHGQSISGARALAPDAAQVFLQPSKGVGTSILYGIPVPFNPQFATGFNANGGIPGIRVTGFVVNPIIKTQYSESWFLNVERQIVKDWIVEVGYVGTNGVNLERIDDVNRFTNDRLGAKVNPNFGPLLFVTNGVSSSYNAGTAEVRHNAGHGLTLKANYRWSKWLDTASDTSTGQFLDNPEPGKGAQDINCLRCERAPSMFDIPHRFTASVVWAPSLWRGGSLLGRIVNKWQISTVVNLQSGRPFSVWNGAPSKLNSSGINIGGDYNNDGGGGAVGGGYYDRPNAPAPGTVKSSLSRQDFIKGLFDPNIFGTPTLGTDGNLGRDTFRGPRQINADLAMSRSFAIRERADLQVRLEAFNVLNRVNLLLPNSDLSLAPVIDPVAGTRAPGSFFGKSTQAFDPRVLQASVRIAF
jgi:Carboxypeptidase regulatory-like domain/TonB dependent receptor